MEGKLGNYIHTVKRRRQDQQEFEEQKKSWQYAPYFQERLRQHQEHVAYLRNRGEISKDNTNTWAWNYTSGKYWRPFNINQPAHVNVEGLEGAENTLYHLIQQMLEARANSSDPRPVMMVDFGAMEAETLQRLTQQFPEPIKQSQLAFVATNLDYQPSISPTGVHFVRGDATELQSATISLPNGLNYPLLKNIDLLHESWVITHDPIPDYTLPMLARMVSPEGVMVLGSRYIGSESRLYSRNEKDRYQEWHTRTKALDLGFGNIESLGLRLDRYDDFEPQPQYAVFRGQNARHYVIK